MPFPSAPGEELRSSFRDGSKQDGVRRFGVEKKGVFE